MRQKMKCRMSNKEKFVKEFNDKPQRQYTKSTLDVVSMQDYNRLVNAHNELLDYVIDLHHYIASLIGLLIDKNIITEAEYIEFGENFELFYMEE